MEGEDEEKKVVIVRKTWTRNRYTTERYKPTYILIHKSKGR